jgi:glucan phosphorylase
MSEQVKERAAEGAQQVQQKAVEAKDQTREKMRQQVDQRSTQTGEQMTRTASALRQTAQHLRGDHQETQAKLIEGVADRADRLGQYLAASDGERLLRDVERFARRQPWVVAGGGALLGFVASRFMKASSTRRYEADGNGSGPSGTSIGYSTAQARDGDTGGV